MRSFSRQGRASTDRRDLVTESLEIEQQVLHPLIPLLWILAKCLADDALEFGGNVRCEVGQRRRLVVEHRDQHVSARRASKRVPVGHHLVQQDTKGPDVRSRVRGVAARLFRRHIVGGADQRSRLGLRRRHRTMPCDRIGRRDELRQAEVEHLDQPIGTHDHVPWLDVPMDDAGAVCGRQGGRDLDRDVERLAQRQRLDEPLIQRLALDVFHRDVGPAVWCLAALVGVADVRMIQGRGGASFLLEPLLTVGRWDVGAQHLERHAAIQLAIARGIDLSHAAHAQQANNLERPELRLRSQEHGSGPGRCTAWLRLTTQESACSIALARAFRSDSSARNRSACVTLKDADIIGTYLVRAFRNHANVSLESTGFRQ